ncbi:MAG: S1 RNA-binding domain-containing protein [Chloroflexi bacterium]|nr:S1 RNA-binding domain-containing protein [Chloroflexota bacterium]
MLSAEALQVGMVLSGTVLYVVDFRRFYRHRRQQDGLLHRSQLPRGKVLTVGDVLEVQIVSVELERVAYRPWLQ